MDPTIGKALREARLKQGLTPDDIAKAIRMRVDWVTDLETEQYHRFPSLGYARKFQILYARHLGVDINKTIMVDPGKAVLATSFDHIYDGVTPVGYRGIKRRQPIKRSRWILALSVGAIACLVGGITALIILDILRLPSWDEMIGEEAEKRTVIEPVLPDPTPVPTPEPTPAPEPAPDPLAEPPPSAPRAHEIFPPSLQFQELQRLARELKAHTPAEALDPFAADAEALATPDLPEDAPPPAP